MYAWLKPGSRFNKLRKVVSGLDPKLSKEDDSFKVAVILLFAARYGQSFDLMYEHLPYGNEFINEIVSRLRENGVFKNGKVCCDWNDEQAGGINFWMDVSIGLGYLEKVQ